VTLLATSSAASCYSSIVNHWVCPAYWHDYSSDLRAATIQHLEITALAVLLGLVIAIPLALAARRLQWMRTPVLGTSTALYTIPSIALLPLLVPFTGLSRSTVVIALAAYALTILVRAILEGFDSVPAEVRDAARGLGYGSARRLLRVDLPLALPVILAGLRVATVSTVALTTVGVIVSYGGLGQLITDGWSSNFRAELFAASVLCILLALVLDAVIVLVGWLLTPWRRA